MIIKSELTNKEYKSVEACLNAEREWLAKNPSDKVIPKVKPTKKDLAKAIEDADNKLTETYKEYDIAREKAKEILERSNKEVSDILEEAEKKIKEIQEKKLETIREFNKEYGAYSVQLTGKRALDECDRERRRFNRRFNNFFDNFFRF